MLFTSGFAPALPLIGLSDAERNLIQRTRLSATATGEREAMELSEAYYLGTQIVQNLRIAVPIEVERVIKTAVGWAALAVDPYVERHAIDCFRLPSGTDADPLLTEIADVNGIEAELPVAFTDALSLGSAYWMVGSREGGGLPVVTVESPLTTSVLWDASGRVARAVFSEYEDEAGVRKATFAVPDQTIHLGLNDAGAWEVIWRDMHGFGYVPLIRQPNRARSNNRAGRSSITYALRTTIDSTCRSLLGLEVARELYSAPRMVLLGAAESSFVGADGKKKTAWETYITRVLGLERDEDGELPDLKQLTVYDPSTFTKLLDSAAARAASEVLAPPQDIGLYTDGNPISADSINATEARRNRRARSQQREAGVALGSVMRMAVRFASGGELPDAYGSVITDWADVEEPAIATVSDAITKQIAAGSIPATSDVTLKKLGWNAVQRQRLADDRKREEGQQIAQKIADAVTSLQGPSGTPTA
ncbi:hypothetical protein GCM10022215_29830 [Nocardioides fonticola]|uniref:Phage portal protein n=1 Tax=Nocardioides fonticola TaxID=450363 RepID=A0ABP7XPE6_9ACTN